MDSKFIPRTLPPIEHGSEGRIKNIPEKSRIIIQEKIDGSQLTIFKRDGTLHFYNKNKAINPKREPWTNAWLALQNKDYLFQEGFYYHGEALSSRQTNVVTYERVPRYHWCLYEIVRQDNSMLTPEELTVLLKDTDIEVVPLLYQSESTATLEAVIKYTLEGMSSGRIKSGLGGKPEGLVLKALNVVKGDKLSQTRLKYVLEEFQELHQAKKKRLPQIPDADFIRELGSVYNTDARKRKAAQHLKERDLWQINPEANAAAMQDELDADLLKEHAEEIKELLLTRFWKDISAASKGDVLSFLKQM